jgi:hypothetical protein
MRIEIPVRLQIYISLHRSDWNDETDLRAKPDDTRLKCADAVAGATVGTDLLIETADRPYKYLFGQELRSAPIQVPIDAALVICARIDEVVGLPGYRRKFVAGLRIKVRVAAATIDGTVTDPDIGQIGASEICTRRPSSGGTAV